MEGYFSYTIDKKDLKITADSTTREYGDNNPTFTASYEGFVADEDAGSLDSRPTLTTTATKTSVVGSYPIVAANAKSNNYEITYEDGTLEVTKAPLTVKVEDVSREYGEANPSYSLDYTGFKNGETVSVISTAPKVVTDATTASSVGTYTLMPSGGEAVNYYFNVSSTKNN